MRPLVISAEVVKQIEAVVAFADANAFDVRTQDQIQHVIVDGLPIQRGNCLVIPVGFQICFTVERHTAGSIRHLSVRLENGSLSRMPSPLAFETIAAVFDMKTEKGQMWLGNATDPAIHLMCPITTVGRAPDLERS
jgi:hypothetical protein